MDLAARAGVTQSVISAYESGQRQPSIPALARLVGAAGFEVTLGLRQPPGRLRRLSGPVGRRVRRHRKEVVAAAAAHGVSNLRVFGSVARGEDHPDSDVDLLAAPRLTPTIQTDPLPDNHPNRIAETHLM